MHLLQEVGDFRLNRVQFCVFDEADRLFEMGFAEQIKEILSGMPPTRQVCWRRVLHLMTQLQASAPLTTAWCVCVCCVWCGAATVDVVLCHHAAAADGVCSSGAEGP